MEAASDAPLLLLPPPPLPRVSFNNLQYAAKNENLCFQQ